MRTVGAVVRGIRSPHRPGGRRSCHAGARQRHGRLRDGAYHLPRPRRRRRDGIRCGACAGQLRNARPDRERRARKDRRRHRGRRVPNPEPQPLLPAAARHCHGHARRSCCMLSYPSDEVGNRLLSTEDTARRGGRRPVQRRSDARTIPREIRLRRCIRSRASTTSTIYSGTHRPNAGC